MDCASYQSLPPVYLKVKRNALLHIGIGNPDDAYDYAAISPYVMVFADDINPPFGVVIPQDEIKHVTVYPCPNSTVGITGSVHLDEIRVICSGTYAPLIISMSDGLTPTNVIGGEEVFFGLDQILTYMKKGDTPPTMNDIDVSFVLENGSPDYRGFVNLQFHPDNPALPNGDGVYFFVVYPSAKIIMGSSH